MTKPKYPKLKPGDMVTWAGAPGPRRDQIYYGIVLLKEPYKEGNRSVYRIWWYDRGEAAPPRFTSTAETYLALVQHKNDS